MTAPLRTRRLLAAVAVCPLLSASLLACGGATEEASGPTEAAGDSAVPAADDRVAGEEVPVAEFVDTVAAGIEASTTARMTNTSSFAGTDISGEGVVDYTRSPPSLQMTMEVPMAGSEMELRSVDGIFYVAMGELTRGRYVKIDPSDPDGPMAGMGLGELVQQGDPLAALRAMEDGIEEVTYVGEEDVDGRDLGRYEVTVDLATSLESWGTDLPPAATRDLPETVTYDLWLDEEGRLGRMVMDLDVGGQQVETEMTLEDWGTEVGIEAPPAGEVIEVPDLGQMGPMGPMGPNPA